ncbi:MAG: TetR/AcrR family transcriptional regulator [Peptococcaceae bacterium]|jgi:AcrR family transcriptional regulator|nr:TetR/AcrR family transcriptional regulator [Peptococcaceae bacterium]
MPADRFFNLPAAKRERIFQAAVREFGRCRFSEASINQIIKDAGIPRGSFYQYFAGKEDLFLYVLGEISREKMAVLVSSGYDPVNGAGEAGFFSLVNDAIPAIFAWADRQADYNMIGLRMAQDDSDFIHDIYIKMDEPGGETRRLIENDQKNGLLRQDADPAMVMYVLRLLAAALIREYYRSADKAGMVERIKTVVNMFYLGLRNDQRGDQRDDQRSDQRND